MLKGLPDTYNIIRKIGEGGAGTVFLGYHRNLEKQVVLKKLKSVTDDMSASRVEVDLLKNLKYPYLPQVYDFLSIEGDIYTVMEYIPGRTFKEYLDNGVVFEVQDVKIWARELCETIVYLHSQKPPIIHGDLKPSNIMLTREGHTCLLDFNISAAMAGYGAKVTGFTPGYAPPEQIIAAKYNEKERDPRNWRSVDQRADIYSFGATIYHILAGRKPVVRSGIVPDIRSYRSDIDDVFASIIMRCLELSPKDRYRSADSLLYALTHMAEESGEYKRMVRRQRITYGLCVLGLIASLAMVVIGARGMTADNSRKYNELVGDLQNSVDEGDFEKAEEYFEEASDLIPGRLSAYYYQALSLKKQADQTHRGSDYRKLISFIQDEVIDNKMVSKAQSGMGDLYYLQGYAYDELGEYQNSVECYRLAIDSNGENVDYYRDYAIALARTGNITGAESTLNEAREKGLDSAAIDYVEGEIDLNEDLPMDALDCFLRAAAGFTDETMKSRAYLSAAKCYDQMGSSSSNIQYKIDMLKKALEELSEDHNMAVLEQLAQAYDDMSRRNDTTDKDYYTEKQIEIYLRMIENKGDTPQRYYNLIISYLNLENPDIQSATAYAGEMEAKYSSSYKTYEAQAFIELSVQKQRDVPDYTKFRELYEKADSMYSKTSDEDEDMVQLEIIYKDSQGW